MKTTTLLTLTLTAFTLTSTLRAADAKPINPALLYWQAASELPQLTPDQSKELRELAAGKQPFDAAIAKSLPNGQTALRLAHKAADSSAICDWGLPTEDGPFMALPHLSKIQEMASLAFVQAEADFAGGKTKEGLDWLLTVHRMARHAGAGDILISNLVQFAIETNALRAAARHCLAWDEATRQTYAAMLQTLPPMHTTQAAYGGERIFVDWLDHWLLTGAENKKEIEDLFKTQEDPDKPQDKEALADQLKPEAMQAAVTELRSLENRTEGVLGQPWTQCQPALKALADEATHSPNFLVRNSYPLIVTVAQKQFVVATLRTMLDAALAHGPQLDEATAATYYDAFEDKPLHLKKADDGTLTLSTAEQHPAGKDLTLSLGK